MIDVSLRPELPHPDLGALFDEHFDYVWGALSRLGVRPSDLEDQVHEVFLRVHRRLADYDTSRPMKPWLFGFVFRVASDHRRLVRHRVEVIGARAEAIASAPSAQEGMEADEERTLVEEALDAVDLDRCAVLIMHDVDDVPIPAVAQVLGIPVGTAYSRLRAARADLAAAVTRLRKTRSRKNRGEP
jgi:RNA polymerase sigma-70 factor (ECF subfamily)